MCAAFLALACLGAAATVRAQDATWLPSPGSSDFNTGSNWSTGTVPTGVATFGASNQTTVTADTNLTFDTLRFMSLAPNYSFTLSNLNTILSGTGVVNDSVTTLPTFSLVNSTVFFITSGSVGNANYSVDANSSLIFFADLPAGGTITNNGALTFTANLGSTDIVTNNGAVTQIAGQTSTGGTGSITVNPGGFFDASGAGPAFTFGSLTGVGCTTVLQCKLILGSNQLTVGGNNRSTEFSGVISDNDNNNPNIQNAGATGGSLVKTGIGTLLLSGANIYTGPTTVSGGTLLLTGSITSDTTVSSGATLSGNGNIAGNVTINSGGTIAPSNVNIGNFKTLSVAGTYTQSVGSFYQAAVNATLQHDLVNVTGPATIRGGTVQVQAQAGAYPTSLRVPILTASNGLTGTFAGVTINQSTLRASLAYDANDAFLIITPGGGVAPGPGVDPPNGGFAGAGFTPNQKYVGAALDVAVANASGDLANVLNTLGVLGGPEIAQALDRLGPEPYSGFATDGIVASRLFMNEIGRQISAGRGAVGSRVTLAEVCASACDAASSDRWSVWASALGGTGSVAGDGNAHALNFTIGGGAGGLDYRLGAQAMIGIAAGYTNATHYLDGLDSRGTSDGYYAGLYGSLSDGALYFDAVAGYARSDNRLRRTIAFSGLTPRTAQGQTHADQLFSQVEAGYRMALGGRSNASLTPFGRLQGSSAWQTGFAESGAGDIDLLVAATTTNALRGILGGDLAGDIELGWSRPLSLQLRVGWSHDYVQDGRAVTAAFAGAPTTGFTVVGAVPPRDSAIVGVAASAAIREATSLYVRYDADINNSAANHALAAGLRMTW